MSSSDGIGPVTGEAGRLVLVGPFVTPVGLDAESLRVRGYADAQRTLCEHLRLAGDRDWSYTPVRSGASGLRFTVTGHANEYALPDSLVRCDGADLTDEVQQACAPVLADTAADWQLTRCTVDFYDFAVGVVTLEFRVPPLDRPGMRAVAVEVERISTLLGAAVTPVTRGLTGEFTAGLRRAIAPAALRAPWFDRPAEQPGEMGVTETGALQYVHRVYVLSVPPQVFDDTVEDAPALLPAFHERLVLRDRAYLPGIDSSVIVHASDAPADVPWLLRMTGLFAAHFAWGLEIDRSLSVQVNGYASDTRDASSTELAAASADILRMYEGIRLVRAQLDTVLANLGGASVTVWEAIASVQRWSQLQAALDTKLDTLQSIHRFRLDALASRRAHRLNVIVAAFTAFTVVSSGVALIDFMYGQQLLGPNAVRVFWAALFLFLCALVLYVAIRERRPRRT